MPIQSISYFKDKFVSGYKITETDWQDLLDSVKHINASVVVSDVSNLEAALEGYRKTADDIPAANIDGLSAAVSALLTNVLTTGSEISQSQIEGLTTALATFITVAGAVAIIEEKVDEAVDGIEVPPSSLGFIQFGVGGDGEPTNGTSTHTVDVPTGEVLLYKNGTGYLKQGVEFSIVEGLITLLGEGAFESGDFYTLTF